jgi:hypothetical protein
MTAAAATDPSIQTINSEFVHLGATANSGGNVTRPFPERPPKRRDSCKSLF